jgi:uroporphyrinogen-III synthase/uroporphyrinogen III methyltransferase/synthase
VTGPQTPPAVLAGPLAGRTVLVPRETPGPDPLVIALHAAGAQPLVVPLIQTVPPLDPTELDDSLLALEVGYYGWVAVTSAAAVPVLVDRAEETGNTLSDLLAGCRVAAVGGTTARALREAGVRVDLVPTGTSSAAALLAAWPPAGDEPERVLLPLGDLASPALAEGLTAHGWLVDVVVTYRTVPGPAPEPELRASWAAGDVDAVLLTSGSTARNLLTMLGAPPAGTLVCCIGESTAAEARRAGLTVHAVAQDQTPGGLVAALTTAALATAPAPDPAGTDGSDGSAADPAAAPRAAHPDGGHA